jgi:hypothetical protein
MCSCLLYAPINRSTKSDSRFWEAVSPPKTTVDYYHLPMVLMDSAPRRLLRIAEYSDKTPHPEPLSIGERGAEGGVRGQLQSKNAGKVSL